MQLDGFLEVLFRLAAEADNRVAGQTHVRHGLARWLDDTKGSSYDASDAQLLAARFAAEPEQLRPLLGHPNVALEQLVGLAATGPRWHVTVADQGGGKYTISVTTPGPPKPTRVATGQ